MELIQFLLTDEVIKINEQHILLFGGALGVRDFALLDSAVMSPQSSFGNVFSYKDVPTMAAVYAFGIIKNHPFVDGNKRTGMAVALIFLDMNNFDIILSNDEVYDIGMKLATSVLKYQEVAEIFKNKTRSRNH